MMVPKQDLRVNCLVNVISCMYLSDCLGKLTMTCPKGGSKFVGLSGGIHGPLDFDHLPHLAALRPC